MVTRRAPGTAERGAVAIIVALSMVALIVAVGLVFDFGLARLDRQTNKSATDAAAAAGLQALDGAGEVRPYKGACAALSYLVANQPALKDGGLSGSWTDGLGNPVSAPCTTPQTDTICDPSDRTTWAVYTGTHSNPEIRVEIKSGYELSDGSFSEESLPSLASDGSEEGGCDQLAVILTETRTPGFGSLATSSDLTTRVRTVGRVDQGEEGEGGVALLMLEQSECLVIDIDSSGASVTVRANGSVPGLIHADTDASGDCNDSSKTALQGDHANGILAEATTGSPSVPGVIRVYAKSRPSPSNERDVDSETNVVAQGGSVEGAPAQVTRKPVDNRYLDGVQQALSEYRATMLLNGSGFTVVPCGATLAELAAPGATEKLWINCTTGPEKFSKAGAVINAGTVVFNAKSVNAPNLSMPNATRVFVKGGTSGGVGVTVNGSLRMHHGGASTCPDTRLTPSANRARLIVGGGPLESTSGGYLQLCSTSVILAGDDPSGLGYVPTSPGADPADNAGNGWLKVNGGPVEWTAPSVTSTQPPDSTYYDDLEDLAFWAETSAEHSLGGNGFIHLSGIFMVPNARFKISGTSPSASPPFDVLNAQFISRTLSVSGANAKLVMQPNPYDVVTIPIIKSFNLVR